MSTNEQTSDSPAENGLDVEAPSQGEEGGEGTYTIDDAVNMAGYGKFQKFLTFLAGLGWFADAFEVIILSIIGDLIACKFTDMERWQNALMTSVVFLGMSVGAPIFGIFADRLGRKTALAVSMLFLFIFGAGSAFAPNYESMTTLRGLMGFALGGIAQGVTLCCEYYPANMRGRAGFYLSYYWAVGAVGVVGIAWVIMTQWGDWRWFVFIASLPALIVFLSMKWYPESARYYVVSGQPEKAVKVLERMAKMNNAEMPKGKLEQLKAGSEQRGKIFDLLKPKMRRTTLLFWYIWLSVACAYYGIALITPYIVTNSSLLDGEIASTPNDSDQEYKQQHQSGSGQAHELNVTLLRAAKENENQTVGEYFRAKMPCKEFSHAEFRDLMWTSAAEIPGIFIFTFTVEHCSRKTYLGTSCVILGLLILLIMLKIEPQVALLVILFTARGLVAAVFQLLFIMTTEAFPTTLRASAMGTGSGCARVGGLIIPYLAQVAVLARPIPAIFVLSMVTILAGVAAFCLPTDTRGKFMIDVVEEAESLKEAEPVQMAQVFSHEKNVGQDK